MYSFKYVIAIVINMLTAHSKQLIKTAAYAKLLVVSHWK